MKTGWKIAKMYSSDRQKMYVYRHVGRGFWDMVWIIENFAGTATSAGIKEGAYWRNNAGYDFFDAEDYTPEERDYHNAVRGAFGEL